MRETAVESHPFGFPLGFARGFGKTGQALFAKCAKKDGAPGLFVMTKVGDETAEVEWLRHPTHRKERDEWGTQPYDSRLEVEASGYRDDTASETSRSLAEVSVGNVIRNIIRVEVQIVEQVEGVNSELKLSAFAEHRHVRQAKGFGQRHIHVPVSRAVEPVAMDTGRLRKRVSKIGGDV